MCGVRKVSLWLGPALAWGCSAAALLGLTAGAHPEGPEAVRIGVLATRGPERCLERWGPTAEYLTAEVPGHSFRITPLGYSEIVPAVERGELDFILANPSLYITLETRCNASRIVTLKSVCQGQVSTLYAGVIFTKAGRDDIRQLADLKGKTFMAVEEDSFGGWEMAWRELKEQGIDPRRDFADLRFGETHDAVVLAVGRAEVDAGTVRSDTLEGMAAEGQIRLDDFQVLAARPGSDAPLPFLHSTRAYPEWPLAKARDTSDGLAQEVAVALMRMSPRSEAANAAQCAGWTIPHNYQSVHECLKELRVGPYEDYGKVTFQDVVARYWPWVIGAAVLLIAACAISFYVMRLNRRLGVALAGYGRELNERIRAEETLRKMEHLRANSEKLAAVGRLAAGVAHEINNPLTGVLTFAHLLREKENLDEQDRQDLDLVIRETQRAGEIVRRLLDFSRETPATKERLDLNEVIRRTVRLPGIQKTFRQITLREDLSENLPEVEGNASQLQQVLLNLCLNGCEAMPDGGTLTVTTAAREQDVLLTVSDTGCGIREDHLDHIFEPFFTTKPVGKGTGLGLSVSYGIIREHGGALEVESREGQGTTFTIVLPCANSETPGNREHERAR